MDELVQLDPSCHPDVEKAWASAKGQFWTAWEEIKFGRDFKKAYDEQGLSKEAFELLRDLDSVRGQLDQRRVVPLARRLGYKSKWDVKCQTQNRSVGSLLHLCRSHMCDLAFTRLQNAGALEPSHAAPTDKPEFEKVLVTPRHFKAFAESLQHALHRFTTPFGHDFVSVTHHNQFPRNELMHHLLVMEGHTTSLLETPMLAEDRLHLLRTAGAIEPMRTHESQEMSEDTLIRDLQAVSDIADQSEDRWVLRTMSKITRDSVQINIAFLLYVQFLIHQSW